MFGVPPELEVPRSASFPPEGAFPQLSFPRSPPPPPPHLRPRRPFGSSVSTASRIPQRAPRRARRPLKPGLGLSRGPDARSPVRAHSAFRGVVPAAPPTRSQPSPLKRRGALGSAPRLRRPPQTPPRGAPPPRRFSPGADWLPREPARPPIGRENDGEGAGPEAAAIPVTRLPASGMLVAARALASPLRARSKASEPRFTSLFPRAERRSGMFRPPGE